MTQQQATLATADELRQVLQGTLSPDANFRRAAEDKLKQAQRAPGHPRQVLSLIASADSADAPVRQAAAVHFKNLVKNGWDESSEDRSTEIMISPEDRQTIKTHLVELMCTVSPQIQAQISESISLVALVDYPYKWENLLPELIQQFNSTDPTVVCAALKTANSIFKRFRYVDRSDDLYRVIIYSLERIQAPLLTLFKTVGTAVDALRNDLQQLLPRFEALRLMARIFFSLNYQDLPEFFEDHMNEWMEEFTKYLTYQNPVLVDDTEEEAPGPIEKLQAAIIENLSLYADKDEESFVPFLPQLTTLVWNLLLTVQPLPKHDALATTSIRFLSSLVKKQMHRQLFQDEATLRQIVTKIVIPNMMVREIDEERFEDDPRDFILTEIEGSHNESRRRCSNDLLRAMCQQFEQETTAICSEHVGSMLAEYNADPNNKWAAKDAAIHLMLGISIRKESESGGVSELNPGVNAMDFFTQNIFPELQDANHSQRPMVKATAIKFVSTFRVQFTREQLVSLMPLLISHLASPSVVVHTYASYAIERILLVKEGAGGVRRPKVGGTEMQPFLNSLFTALFSIIGNEALNENDLVMKCVMRSLFASGSDIVPVTDEVIRQLTAALARVAKNPRNPQFNHYLFESIAVLIRSVCSKDPNAIEPMEQLLFPPFQAILQQNVVEFLPYVFQVLAQLLEYRPLEAGLSDVYAQLFPPLLTIGLWESKGNVPAITRLVKAYLRQAAPVLVSNGHLDAILGVFQKLLATPATEVHALGLLEVITIYVPQESLQPMLSTVFRLLFTRLQTAKTDRFKRLITNYCAIYVGIRGAQPFYDVVNSLQSGLALTFIVQVWGPRLVNDPPKRLDAKIQVVGVTKLLCDSPALLGDDQGKAVFAQCLAGLVTILSSPDMLQAQANEDGFEMEEVAYDSKFSELAFARQAAFDPFPGVNDAGATFVQSLQALSTSHPGVLQPIINQAVANDPKLANGLQSLMARAGVNLF